ncbi:MAG: helix-turn-helix transcriptional regulator [Myxococcota bacterium]
MKRPVEHAVSFVEAAYDLQPNPSDWLHRLVESAHPLLDRGFGCVAAVITGAGRDSLRVPLTATSGHDSLECCLNAAMRQSALPSIGPLIDRRRHGVRALAGRAQCAVHSHFRDTLGCDDVLEAWGVDAEARGVVFYAPSSASLELTPDEVDRWRALTSHVAAAYRIRRGLGLAVPELSGKPEVSPRARCIRKASIRADETATVAEARNIAEIAKLGVMHGHWSMLDWFDANGRRFVLVRPNGPGARDPRALSVRERQVATYAAQGESGKIVGYRLGISAAHVSNTLRSAMRKLKVRTQAQLVIQMRCLEGESRGSG